jgi:hypothetical protein
MSKTEESLRDEVARYTERLESYKQRSERTAEIPGVKTKLNNAKAALRAHLDQQKK